MKKIVILICLVLLGTTAFAQQLGEKVYKEVIINGQRVNRWLEVVGIQENDEKENIIYIKHLFGEVWYEFRGKYYASGNEIYEKWSYGLSDGVEYWNDYDAKGNKIHTKSSDGTETWFEYDARGNRTHSKSSNGSETWFEYDAKGNRIHFKSSDGTETWFEYDAKGHKIHEKDNNRFEEWFDYDAKGNLIHEKSSDGREKWYDYDAKGHKIHAQWASGYECWYEYEYWKNGKVKKEIEYSAF